MLTLYNTPFSLLAGYRHNVVNRLAVTMLQDRSPLPHLSSSSITIATSFILIVSILSLKALDRYVISDEEIVENLHLDGKFKSESASFKLQLYQPLPQVRDLISTAINNLKTDFKIN